MTVTCAYTSTIAFTHTANISNIFRTASECSDHRFNCTTQCWFAEHMNVYSFHTNKTVFDDEFDHVNQ